jgi:hypothetical protein
MRVPTKSSRNGTESRKNTMLPAHLAENIRKQIQH